MQAYTVFLAIIRQDSFLRQLLNIVYCTGRIRIQLGLVFEWHGGGGAGYVPKQYNDARKYIYFLRQTKYW